MRYNLLAGVLKRLNSGGRKGSLFCVSGRSISADSRIGDAVVEEARTHSAEQCGERSLHIAVIGVPNVGKSTFINHIVNHRVCPTSAKVHTTRRSNTAICTTGKTQLVFYDTPGLVTQREIRKHHLEQSFKSGHRHAIQHADCIAVVHDASNGWTRKELHPTVLDTLKAYANLPSFLVLNKIDALKSKRMLLEVIKTLTNNTLTGRRGTKAPLTADGGSVLTSELRLNKRVLSWSHFSDVFLVSAMTGSGLFELQEYLMGQALSRNWRFSADVRTDACPEALIVESVRARLLDYLPQEIPYKLNCALEHYSVQKNVIYSSVQVHCPTSRIERLICGESNGKLRQITERVTSDLVEMFGQAVSLTISTVSKGAKTVL
ncbi:hypothetical protein KR018_009639 [Drosophila ironensis]|nr:hypothetical protein KR018_009639 [Drosophila ironensis]